jgi:hypothetical protein
MRSPFDHSHAICFELSNDFDSKFAMFFFQDTQFSHEDQYSMSNFGDEDIRPKFLPVE